MGASKLPGFAIFSTCLGLEGVPHRDPKWVASPSLQKRTTPASSHFQRSQERSRQHPQSPRNTHLALPGLPFMFAQHEVLWLEDANLLPLKLCSFFCYLRRSLLFLSWRGWPSALLPSCDGESTVICPWLASLVFGPFPSINSFLHAPASVYINIMYFILYVYIIFCYNNYVILYYIHI